MYSRLKALYIPNQQMLILLQNKHPLISLLSQDQFLYTLYLCNPLEQPIKDIQLHYIFIRR